MTNTAIMHCPTPFTQTTQTFGGTREHGARKSSVLRGSSAVSSHARIVISDAFSGRAAACHICNELMTPLRLSAAFFRHETRAPTRRRFSRCKQVRKHHRNAEQSFSISSIQTRITLETKPPVCNKQKRLLVQIEFRRRRGAGKQTKLPPSVELECWRSVSVGKTSTSRATVLSHRLSPFDVYSARIQKAVRAGVGGQGGQCLLGRVLGVSHVDNESVTTTILLFPDDRRLASCHPITENGGARRRVNERPASVHLLPFSPEAITL